MKIGALGVGMAMLFCACSTTLERGLSEPQADEVVVALGARGIGASKDADRGGDGFSVIVLESDVASALAVLREEGLPRAAASGLAETYAEASLIPTAGEERARMAAALGADLARTIESLDGVHDARVHVGLPDPSVVPMDEAGPVAVASVLVRTEPAETVDQAAVRALVAGAVPGLAPAHVTVVMVPVTATRTASEPLVSIGPMFVTRGSAFALRSVLATMLGVNIALVVAVGVVMRGRRG